MTRPTGVHIIVVVSAAYRSSMKTSDNKLDLLRQSARRSSCLGLPFEIDAGLSSGSG